MSVATQQAGKLGGPYVLYDLLGNIQLTEEGIDSNVYITCVEFWGKCISSVLVLSVSLEIDINIVIRSLID